MKGPIPTEKATQASSQGNPPSSTSSNLNVMADATPVINDANRDFTLFPKLQVELHLKVWKHTLPGPRVIPIYTRHILRSWHNAVSRRFASLNSFINITSVCHESQAVVMDTYDKLFKIVCPSLDVGPTDYKPQPFVYVNYNIDTIYVERLFDDRGTISIHLGNAQHIAVRDCERESPKASMEWAMLKAAFPKLESLTFVATWDFCEYRHDEEWLLVDVTASFGTAITLPQLASQGFYDVDHYVDHFAKVVVDHGNIAFLCAAAKVLLGNFEKNIRNQTEWKNVSLMMAIHARRKIGSIPWILTYQVYNNITHMEDNCHWHEEPVLLGDVALTSCGPVVHSNLLCDGCGRQRWLQSKDAFWLPKGEGEEDNRSGRSHDSSAGSAEYVTDDEPENDIEEGTENASEEFDDNIETFTREESGEFAELY